MKIAFHGAARTVTGSKHLLTLNSGTTILLDCGMFQGMGNETDALNATFGFDAVKVDFVILSHAHIDHSGLLPKLTKEGFRGRIFCTPATKDLCTILLENSANIQMHDNPPDKLNIWKGSKEEVEVDTHYTQEDVKETIRLMEIHPYGEWFTVQDGVEAMYTDAGHIVGSAAVQIKIMEDGKETHICFSGDVGRYTDAILRPPATFPQADYLILESTYGDKLHTPMLDNIDAFLQQIQRTCMEKKGKLIIPAFSIGRTQELLYFLNQLSLDKRLPDIPVIVDSPLSHAATQITKSYTKDFNEKVQQVLEKDDDPFDFPGLRFVIETEDSKKLNSMHEPMIIIAASGMADAGHIRHHIRNNVEDNRNTVLIVGYCDPHSLGGRLKNGDKKVWIMGRDYNVVADVAEMQSMSAHGDYNDLLHFASCQDAGKIRTLFLVHGEYDVQQQFSEKLMAKGFGNVYIPALHEVCEL